MKSFGIAIEFEALVKNLISKNKGYMTRATEAKEAGKRLHPSGSFEEMPSRGVNKACFCVDRD